MDFDVFRNKRVAALYYGCYSNLPKGLGRWGISDLDAFYDNLDLWDAPEGSVVDILFSPPIKGVKQHLANCSSCNVGVAGERLGDIAEEVKREYMKRGYDVLEIKERDSDIKYSQCEFNDDEVRLIWKD